MVQENVKISTVQLRSHNYKQHSQQLYIYNIFLVALNITPVTTAILYNFMFYL